MHWIMLANLIVKSYQSKRLKNKSVICEKSLHFSIYFTIANMQTRTPQNHRRPTVTVHLHQTYGWSSKTKINKTVLSTEKKKLHCTFKTIQGWIFNHTDRLCISECTNKCGARYEAEKNAHTNIQRRCCCSKQADAAMQWLIIERCSSRADYKTQRRTTKQRCSSSNAARAINARAAEKNREAADSSVIRVREFIADSSTSPLLLKQEMYMTPIDATWVAVKRRCYTTLRVNFNN